MDGLPVKVLLVEDNPGDARLVREMLAEAGAQAFGLDHVELLGDAERRLGVGDIDAVLLDLSLPDAKGLEAVNRVRAADSGVPIVVLSGHSDEALALQAVQKGVQDYLVKGSGTGDGLARAVRYAIERKRLEERLAYMARHDELTGLANRALFREHLAGALNRADHSNKLVVLMFLDLDRFKAVNDTLGHDRGDLLLKDVAERLTRCVRKGDIIARLGGDEFTIILEGVSHAEEAAVVAAKIISILAQPFSLGGHEVFVTSSIGLAVYPECGREAEILIKDADTAMYRAKQAGRNNYQFATPELSVADFERRNLYSSLERAIADEAFVLHYQPQIDLSGGGVMGVEALVRWERPDAGLVGPADFIALAEKSGLIVPLGEWVLRAACKQSAEWQARNLQPTRMWINVSPRQFRATDLSDVIARVLGETGLDPHHLGIEITEGLLIDNVEATRSTLLALRRMGVEIAIDDFGTGYSSLAYLKRLPLDTLKIDRSFVRDICDDPDAAAIANATVDLAHNLRLAVIAEGVETVGQEALLRDRGCDAAQGHLYSRPLPAESFAHWLQELQPSRHVAAG